MYFSFMPKFLGIWATTMRRIYPLVVSSCLCSAMNQSSKYGRYLR